MKKYLPQFCFSAVILSIFLSLACDCNKKPIETEIKNTKYIIAGQVWEFLDKKDSTMLGKFIAERSYKVKMRVLKSYKGGIKKESIIEIGSDYSSCSIAYKKGGKYMLFLKKNEKTGKYYQIPCSYSDELTSSLATIKKLEKTTIKKKK